MSAVTSCWRHIWTTAVIVVVVVIGLIVGWNRLVTGSSGGGSAEPYPQLATVNGAAITQAMVDRELKISRLNVAAPLPPLTGEDLERAEEEALNQLITRQMILQAARRQGFSLDEAFIAKRAELLFGHSNDAGLGRALEQAGGTYADVLWWIGEIITVEEFTTQVIMAEAAPENRQQVYNEWLNSERAEAKIVTFLAGEVQPPTVLVGEPATNFALTNLQ